MIPGISLRLAMIAAALIFTTPDLQAKEKIVAYVPNWGEPEAYEAFVKTIDYAHISHINIAFENPTNDQGDLSFNEKNDVLIAMAHAKNVKVLVSICGGSESENETKRARYYNLLTEPNRADFVAKLAKYVNDHGFDGLDVDIEGPAINKDYGAFIRELSAALKPKGKLLTAALSKGYEGDRVPTCAFENFDFVNVMAYDETGPWDKTKPGQHSSLEFAKNEVDYWLNRKLPASKTVLGVPFYGRGFGKKFSQEVYLYSKLVADYPDAEKSDQVGETIWYNGIPTIVAKTKYAIDRKLAGIMIWSLDSDVKGEKSLLDAIIRTYRSRSAEVPSAVKNAPGTK